MRLNLPNINCIRFKISSDFTATEESDKGIQYLMKQTEHFSREPIRGDESERMIAHFGSRSTFAGTAHRILGHLSRRQRADGPAFSLSITMNRASERLSHPPKEFRPVSLLVREASLLLGPINLSCEVVFEYDQDLGYRSKVTFPMPLIVQEDPDGVTHIESALFSRRDKDSIKYEILVVDRENTNTFTHMVSFEENLELSRDSLKSMLSKAKLISTRLLTR